MLKEALLFARVSQDEDAVIIGTTKISVKLEMNPSQLEQVFNLLKIRHHPLQVSIAIKTPLELPAEEI